MDKDNQKMASRLTQLPFLGYSLYFLLGVYLKQPVYGNSCRILDGVF